MKLISILLFLVFSSTSSWAQSGADVPPPPMPEYMKKHNFKAPPPPPSKSKLQSPAMDLPPVTATPSENKFLEKKKPQPKAFLKKESSQTKLKKKIDEQTSAQNLKKATPETKQTPPEALDKSLVENQDAEDEESYEAIEPVADISQDETNENEAITPEFDQKQNEELILENAQSNYLNDGEELTKDNTENTDLNPIAQTNENLAEVEELLESKEQAQEKTLNSSRSVAETKTFKSGMYKFSNECIMRTDASSLSEESGKIRAGQKIWIDNHNANWHKVYKKSGAAYIPSECLK